MKTYKPLFFVIDLVSGLDIIKAQTSAWRGLGQNSQ